MNANLWCALFMSIAFSLFGCGDLNGAKKKEPEPSGCVCKACECYEDGSCSCQQCACPSPDSDGSSEGDTGGADDSGGDDGGCSGGACPHPLKCL